MKCPKCGGRLILRRIGNYADDYQIGRDGKPSAKRLRRIHFEYAGTDYCSVFCEDCLETFEWYATNQKSIKLLPPENKND